MDMTIKLCHATDIRNATVDAFTLWFLAMARNWLNPLYSAFIISTRGLCHLHPLLKITTAHIIPSPIPKYGNHWNNVNYDRTKFTKITTNFWFRKTQLEFELYGKNGYEERHNMEFWIFTWFKDQQLYWLVLKPDQIQKVLSHRCFCLTIYHQFWLHIPATPNYIRHTQYILRYILFYEKFVIRNPDCRLVTHLRKSDTGKLLAKKLRSSKINFSFSKVNKVRKFSMLGRCFSFL